MRARKIDNTATALIAYAKSIGFDYESINGVIDGILALGMEAFPVDWKSPGGELTKAQQKLVARGFPLWFISRPEQLDALKAHALRKVA